MPDAKILASILKIAISKEQPILFLDRLLVGLRNVRFTASEIPTLQQPAHHRISRTDLFSTIAPFHLPIRLTLFIWADPGDLMP